MKILYGIQLNGNGHINRSIEIINKLIENEHNIDIITSGKNSDLKLPYNIKNNFNGLKLIYNKKGSINWIKTIKSSNLIQLIYDIKNFKIKEYDLVISDFEPISAWSAKLNNIKSIGISNQYSLVINNNFPKNNLLSKLFVKYFAPCKYYIGIDYTTDIGVNIFYPIISEKLLKNDINNKNYYIIYLPSIHINNIIKVLETNKCSKWIIYSNDDINNFKYKNIQIKKTGSDSFMYDFLNCNGVITNCGFSTTTESLILNKKLWAIPIKGQIEQKYNSIMLEKLGVFTGEFNQINLKKWFTYKRVNYELHII